MILTTDTILLPVKAASVRPACTLQLITLIQASTFLFSQKNNPLSKFLFQRIKEIKIVWKKFSFPGYLYCYWVIRLGSLAIPL
jgi:hypothetical protein